MHLHWGYSTLVSVLLELTIEMNQFSSCFHFLALISLQLWREISGGDSTAKVIHLYLNVPWKRDDNLSLAALNHWVWVRGQNRPRVLMNCKHLLCYRRVLVYYRTVTCVQTSPEFEKTGAAICGVLFRKQEQRCGAFSRAVTLQRLSYGSGACMDFHEASGPAHKACGAI